MQWLVCIHAVRQVPDTQWPKQDVFNQCWRTCKNNIGPPTLTCCSFPLTCLRFHKTTAGSHCVKEQSLGNPKLGGCDGSSLEVPIRSAPHTFWLTDTNEGTKLQLQVGRMLGSSKILHWQIQSKSSSGNPGILEGQIARMIIQGIHRKARYVSWSLGNQCKQQWHPSPLKKKTCWILDTHTRPPRVNYFRRNLGNFSKVQDFTSLLAMLCHLKQLLIHHGDDVDQRLRT